MSAVYISPNRISIKRCKKNDSTNIPHLTLMPHAETRIPEEESVVHLSSPCVTGAKTKKRKTVLSSKSKSQLWEIFDQDAKSMGDKSIAECLWESDVPAPAPAAQQQQEYSAKKSIVIYDTHLCIACQSVMMIMEDGIPTCTNKQCGRMNRDTLDYSPEWRYYGAEDKNAKDPTRCGNPINPLLAESSIGCKIICAPNSSYEMKRIRKWTEWQAMPHREKSLYDEFQFITIMSQNAGIPKIFIDDAMAIHKDISEQKMFRGMNRDGIKAASIYISCRLNGCPRTAHEIAEIFHLDKTSATTGCSMAVNIMNNIDRNGGSAVQRAELCATTPSSFIDRYCSRLNVNQELTMLSKFIAMKVESSNYICDNTPHSVAAGIIYFVAQMCNLNISKADIKHICGVSEVTINKCFRKLEAIEDKLIPKCVRSKYA